ncbi:hypothetical protein SLEP1_g21672 [Rubroshorea leprosula]|uniref:beta-aspartyl-peptidase n=1 Tax=Rubroshorea leprosula TaxID=152421 RepID=A0AAV5JC36_9ROSI|nr:hypothetical protein SLEP1_g21672 [Rubroshorea leprosula]
MQVRELESDPLFNSGRGSALTAKGTEEMEASILDGNKRMCSAVSGVTTVKNPISLSRLVMEKSPHSYLAFSGGEDFGWGTGSKLHPGTACAAAKDSQPQMNGLPISLYEPETVGCVVVDSEGRCAAATSTGGLMNKMTGRIGDSPIIGAGTYSCDLCGVSCTGEGEAIIRRTLAREVAAVMEYKGLNLQQEVDFVIKEKLDQGFAGLIAGSKNG